MTDKQRQLLQDVKTAGSCFLRGSDVRIAKVLAQRGYVTLEDNGKMLSVRGRSDNERWFCTFVREPEDFIRPGTKVVLMHHSKVPEFERFATVTKCEMWPEHVYSLQGDGFRCSGYPRKMLRRIV